MRCSAPPPRTKSAHSNNDLDVHLDSHVTSTHIIFVATAVRASRPTIIPEYERTLYTRRVHTMNPSLARDIIYTRSYGVDTGSS